MLRLIGVNASAGGVAGGFDSIATVTATGSTTNITFSSIPTTYQHLQLRIHNRGASTNFSSDRITFNSDTSANYAWHQISGTGSAVAATGVSSNTFLLGGIVPGPSFSSSIFGVSIIDIHDYSNTSKNTTVRTTTGVDTNGDGRMTLRSGLWVNTAAINSITITNGDSVNYVSGSTFALYGIKAAA